MRMGSSVVVARLCRYTIVVKDGSVDVGGVISVRGHYFEDGNIQLQTSKTVETKNLSFTVGWE